MLLTQICNEFGNARLNREPAGSFSHFVLTAVLLEEAKLAQARELQADISRRYFQGHPIQSSRISDDELGFQMRLDILQELRQLDFLVLSLVINKSKVAGEGLSQQDIFYKLQVCKTLSSANHSFPVEFNHIAFNTCAQSWMAIPPEESQEE